MKTALLTTALSLGLAALVVTVAVSWLWAIPLSNLAFLVLWNAQSIQDNEEEEE